VVILVGGVERFRCDALTIEQQSEEHFRSKLTRSQMAAAADGVGA
jgi:hypothetical protein